MLFGLPGLMATHLGNVGSNQLDISTDGGGARSVVGLPQQLVFTTEGEVWSSTVDMADSKAAVEGVRSRGV